MRGLSACAPIKTANATTKIGRLYTKNDIKRWETTPLPHNNLPMPPIFAKPVALCQWLAFDSGVNDRNCIPVGSLTYEHFHSKWMEEAVWPDLHVAGRYWFSISGELNRE